MIFMLLAAQQTPADLQAAVSRWQKMADTLAVAVTIRLNDGPPAMATFAWKKPSKQNLIVSFPAFRMEFRQNGDERIEIDHSDQEYVAYTGPSQLSPALGESGQLLSRCYPWFFVMSPSWITGMGDTKPTISPGSSVGGDPTSVLKFVQGNRMSGNTLQATIGRSGRIYELEQRETVNGSVSSIKFNVVDWTAKVQPSYSVVLPDAYTPLRLPRAPWSELGQGLKSTASVQELARGARSKLSQHLKGRRTMLVAVDAGTSPTQRFAAWLRELDSDLKAGKVALVELALGEKPGAKALHQQDAWLWDDRGEAQAAWRFAGTPFAVLIEADGTIRAAWHGAALSEKDQVLTELRQAIGQK